MNWKQRLGDQIRRARKRHGITRGDLREALSHKGLSVSLNSLGFYERGTRAPDVNTLRTIAAVLGSDHFEIIDEDEKGKNWRIEFSMNGRTRPEPMPQQLNLEFDEGGGVTVRIESINQGVSIKKISA